MEGKEFDRGDLMDAVDKRLDVDGTVFQALSNDAVQATFEQIIAALTTQDRVEIRDFGVFRMKPRKPRKYSVPNEEGGITVVEKPRRLKLSFRVSRKIADALSEKRGIPVI